MNKTHYAILGAGSWGTALSMLLASNGNKTTLWAHTTSHANALQKDRANKKHLGNIKFPESLNISDDLNATIQQATRILIVVPSHSFRNTCKALATIITPQHKIAWASKGLEADSNKLLHQIAKEEFPPSTPLAVLSGPTFAKEVAQGLPGAVTIASTEKEFALELANDCHSRMFRAYTSSDMVGVEVGGAVKNVMAIAAGIADGLGFGSNTRAALIARGVAEMMRLGVTLGAQKDTFMGLTGLGDLVLTCSDDQSRNRRFGLALGKGQTQQQALDDIQQVVEGRFTAKAVYQLSQQQQIDMPITEQVYKVLFENLDPKVAAQALMERAIRPEIDN